MDIRSKVAVITGGASGLGFAAAQELHAAGASVALLDLETSDGETSAKELGDRALFVPTDVTDEGGVKAAIETAAEEFGGLHIAVNCAGVGWAERVLNRENQAADLGRFEFVIRVNLIGTFNVMRLAAARMSAQEPVDEERGVIVNTASIAAFDGQIGQAAYAASKGGIVSLTLPVARDLASRMIRCVAIAPGTFDTPMLGGLPEEARQKLADAIPHPHRLGKPEEFGRLVRNIVENPMLNGEVIRLDGALRMPPK